jgi:hypothetical protein
MQDNNVLEAAPRNTILEKLTPRPVKEVPVEPQDEDEFSCPAFGYMRGIRDRGLAVEFRFRDGTNTWFPYAWLGPFHYHPSAGLLMKFTGDTITLVLIRGSNLDLPVRQGTMTLMDRGLQRHRITFIREMDEDELRRAGEKEPTIDSIEMAEFETQDDLREWMKANAPAFCDLSK